MKLIKKSETSICCGCGKGGKKKFQTVTENKEIDFAEILDFNIKENGEDCQYIEDKIQLFESFFEILILKYPEDFRNYLEVCAKKKSGLYTSYKIKN